MCASGRLLPHAVCLHSVGENPSAAGAAEITLSAGIPTQVSLSEMKFWSATEMGLPESLF